MKNSIVKGLALIGPLIAQPALAGGGKGGAPAPHVSAPAAHPAMAAPRAAMPAARAPMMASRPAAPAARFAAPAAHAAAPSAYASHAGHLAAPAGHFGGAAGHFGGAAAGAHAGMAAMHAEGRGEAFHAEAGRAGEARAGGREELAHDDPARAHGRFDEHVRNPERERDIVRMHEHDFHVRDVRYFNDREWGRWRGGYWHRDYYDGRFGWWFDVGGVYYPYEAPIWPYPLYVAPLIAADYVAAPPPAVPIAPLPALPRVAYHCASPSGFYPAVDSCDAGWVTLAAH